MIAAEFRTEDLPVAERFGFWHDFTAETVMPTEISSDHMDDFRATMRALDLGAVQISAMTYPSMEIFRTAKLIRRSDPEVYMIVLTLRGEHRLIQAGRAGSRIGPYDLTIGDSSRLFHGRVTAAEGSTVSGVVAQVPRVMVPLPAGEVDRLLAVRLPGSAGIGALLARFLARLTTDARQYRPADAPRLGTVLTDLVVALVAHELDAEASVPPESHRRALVLRIRAFIGQHIGEAELTPAMIAAAHHISLRQLHRLFQEQGISVAAWIRSQRLEGCRRDLADPALRSMSIHAVAARWGFGHPAVFSRVFRNAYGLSPRDHRQQALGGTSERPQP